MKKIGVKRPEKYSMRWRENRKRNNSNFKCFEFCSYSYILYDKINYPLKTKLIKKDILLFLGNIY
jgi:hypothetical protein